jgi:hypothetical protein
VIIAVYSRLKVDQILKYAHLFVWVLCAIALFGVGSFFLPSLWETDEGYVINEQKISAVNEPPSGLYELIGTGPLSLKYSHMTGMAAFLSQEILILAKNTRPDAKKKGALLLALKSSRQQKVVTSGEKIYLSADKKSENEEERWQFSDEKTALSIKPLILDPNTLVIEGLKEADPERALLEEKGQLVLKGQGAQKEEASEKIEDPSFVSLLKQAKCWGRDLLFQQYGGQEYSLLQNKCRLEFLEGSSSYFCFIAQGDTLSYDGSKWKEVLLEEVSLNAPLAMIRVLDSNGVEIEVWDETGFHSRVIKQPQQAGSKISLKVEELPSGIRLRTASEVSCALGKRRVLLKEGDWLLKNASGWHNLKKIEEIDECIQHRSRGELFIFDRLEKEEGKYVLKGHLFDEMRTQMQLVALPLAQEKRAAAPKKKKKGLFPKKAAPSGSKV